MKAVTWNQLGAQRGARSSTTRRGLMQREGRTASRAGTEASALLDRLQKPHP